MPTRRRIDLATVLASLDEICPLCRAAISPAESRWLDGERKRCPHCGEAYLVVRKPLEQCRYTGD